MMYQRFLLICALLCSVFALPHHMCKQPPYPHPRLQIQKIIASMKPMPYSNGKDQLSRTSTNTRSRKPLQS